ncbi:hypothetical protein J1605_003161 [Eschrichtius robustus]|uniref:Uncharacterized protein n=1 Tax=Eschrichtius robustus TaxID=9764 RepID=A0AB34HSJ3_ESCRO|nr:hypothetical protein J1605_003161 [Eschrichtius robustus]
MGVGARWKKYGPSHFHGVIGQVGRDGSFIVTRLQSVRCPHQGAQEGQAAFQPFRFSQFTPPRNSANPPEPPYLYWTLLLPLAVCLGRTVM